MCLSENADSRQVDTKQADFSTSSVGNGGNSWTNIKYIRLLIHDTRARQSKKPKQICWLIHDVRVKQKRVQASFSAAFFADLVLGALAGDGCLLFVRLPFFGLFALFLSNSAMDSAET